MRILFVGCVESSRVLLDALLKNKCDVCGVITKHKSDFNSDFTDLSPLCKKHNIDIHYTDDINGSSTFNYVDSLNPDVIYCFGWSQLLGKRIIDVPDLGVVGFHPAKLPYNKGRHPIIWALVLGLDDTASSFFMIDEKADNGDIISQVEIDIAYEDYAEDLYRKIMDVAKIQVLEITKSFKDGTVEKTKQLIEGNKWRKRGQSDGKIDFRMSMDGIYNLVRGLSHPYAGAHFEYNDNDYKVWRCVPEKEYQGDITNFEYGKILEVTSENEFFVRVGDGVIRIIDCDKIFLKKGDYL